MARALLFPKLPPTEILLIKSTYDVGKSFRKWYPTTCHVSLCFAFDVTGPQDLNTIVSETPFHGEEYPTEEHYAAYFERMMVEMGNTATIVERALGFHVNVL